MHLVDEETCVLCLAAVATIVIMKLTVINKRIIHVILVIKAFHCLWLHVLQQHPNKPSLTS